jgi:hypothetical protein
VGQLKSLNHILVTLLRSIPLEDLLNEIEKLAKEEHFETSIKIFEH